MIKLIPVKVESYSGFKADEYPKCFIRESVRFDILEIVDRWYQGDSNPDLPVSNYFKVTVAGGEEYLLKYEIEADEWYLCIK
jgi:hypothetical protein